MNITSSIFEPCGHKGALALCEEPNLPALRVSSSNRLIGVYFDVLPIKLVSCYPRLLTISMRRLRLNQACVSCYPLYMYCKFPVTMAHGCFKPFCRCIHVQCPLSCQNGCSTHISTVYDFYHWMGPLNSLGITIDKESCILQSIS